MSETNHPSSLATCTLIQDLLGVTDGGIYEAVVNLKQRLNAVVAECAGLREQSEEVYAAGYNHGHLNTVDGIAYAPGTKDEFYSLALQVMAEAATPTVTAALAEVEAKAIEKHIASLKKMLAELDPEIFAYGQVKAALESAMFWAEKFAVELREAR
ncbi:hypothetical protein J8631_09755 [Serratia fonticola]|uniref:hypothetical protein n=1 Tax=Serratia fonticola TaxID=47917 RepID=UPI001AE2EC67|nr:hypothetical protein [Serratia fonticola]MBP1035843.1 hypothetical protein [Serratia fonticola]